LFFVHCGFPLINSGYHKRKGFSNGAYPQAKKSLLTFTAGNIKSINRESANKTVRSRRKRKAIEKG